MGCNVKLLFWRQIFRYCSQPNSCFTSCHMFTPTSEAAFRKGGILHIHFRRTSRHIAALTLEQLCHLFYLKRATDTGTGDIRSCQYYSLKSFCTGAIWYCILGSIVMLTQLSCKRPVQLPLKWAYLDVKMCTIWQKGLFSTYKPEDTDSTAPGLKPTPRGGWSWRVAAAHSTVES